MAEPTEVLAQQQAAPLPTMPTGVTTSARAYEEVGKLVPQLAQAEADVKRAEAGLEQQKLEGRARAQQEYADKIRSETERTQKMIKDDPFSEFRPTQDNAQSLGSLFSLTATIGLLLGNAGKGNSVAAMNAMTGMLSGWRQGRADLFNREKAEFDKQWSTIKARHEEYKKDLEQYLKLAAVDRDAAAQQAELIAVKAGSNSVIGAYARRNDVKGLIDQLNAQAKIFEKKEEIDRRAQERRQDRAETERRHRETMAQRERLEGKRMEMRERELTAREAAKKLKEEAKAPTGVKSDAKDRNAYIADNILKADVSSIAEDLKDPELQQLIRNNRIEAFLTEEAKTLNQLLSSDIPEKLQEFLTKVRDVRNNYYLNISGKAVTGGEALRNYGVVPQPGDTPEVMQNKLQGMIGRIDKTIKTRQKFYGFPELPVEAGQRTPIEPSQDTPLNFSSVQEAEAAGLPPGTKVLINGRPAKVE